MKYFHTFDELVLCNVIYKETVSHGTTHPLMNTEHHITILSYYRPAHAVQKKTHGPLGLSGGGERRMGGNMG